MDVGERCSTVCLGSYPAVQERAGTDNKVVLLGQASHVSTAGMTHRPEKVEIETPCCRDGSNGLLMLVAAA